MKSAIRIAFLGASVLLIGTLSQASVSSQETVSKEALRQLKGRRLEQKRRRMRRRFPSLPRLKNLLCHTFPPTSDCGSYLTR